MNNPNYANLNRSHTTGQMMNNSPGSMGMPYGAMDGDMMGDEQNDALQVRPVEHLESMSKLPAHKRRFSATVVSTCIPKTEKWTLLSRERRRRRRY